MNLIVVPFYIFPLRVLNVSLLRMFIVVAGLHIREDS